MQSHMSVDMSRKQQATKEVFKRLFLRAPCYRTFFDCVSQLELKCIHYPLISRQKVAVKNICFNPLPLQEGEEQCAHFGQASLC